MKQPSDRLSAAPGDEAAPGDDDWQSEEERRESERTSLLWQRHVHDEEADQQRGSSTGRRVRMVVLAVIAALIALLALQQMQLIG
jgi:hypothetical protein